jgi:hypothetical protein
MNAHMFRYDGSNLEPTSYVGNLYNYMRILDTEEFDFVKQGFCGINLKLYDRFNFRAEQVGHETEAIMEIFHLFNVWKEEYERSKSN